jgi:hypothetical protein
LVFTQFYDDILLQLTRVALFAAHSLQAALYDFAAIQGAYFSLKTGQEHC